MKATKTMLPIDITTLTLLIVGISLLTIVGYRWWVNHPKASTPGQAPSLQQLIGDLRHQLLEAEKARRTSGEPALFKIGKCDIEVNVVVKSSDTIKGGFTYEVITAERASELSSEQVQKVTLHLDSVEQREIVVPPSEPGSIK